MGDHPAVDLVPLTIFQQGDLDRAARDHPAVDLARTWAARDRLYQHFLFYQWHKRG